MQTPGAGVGVAQRGQLLRRYPERIEQLRLERAAVQ
jgi:hypothetical protein